MDCFFADAPKVPNTELEYFFSQCIASLELNLHERSIHNQKASL